MSIAARSVAPGLILAPAVTDGNGDRPGLKSGNAGQFNSWFDGSVDPSPDPAPLLPGWAETCQS
jgi:hypothetical protein